MSNVFKKEDLIASVAEKCNVTKVAADAAVTAVFQVVKEAVLDKGLDFRMPELGGVLKKAVIPAHEAVKPGTKDKIQVPERVKVRYKYTPKEA